MVTLTGGFNFRATKSSSFATLRLAPSLYLPHAWQIGMQVVYFTKNAPTRQAYGNPVYTSISVNKQLGRHLNIGIDWHDIFDGVNHEALINRHAANIKLQYRF